MPKIVIEKGANKGKVYVISGNGTLIFGRDTDNHIQLGDSLASRQHFKIVAESSRYTVGDMGSTNGTFVNGDRLIGQRVLLVGDKIQVGETLISFLADDESQKKDALVGTTVAGYRIIERIGRGGMGTVYKTTQLSLNRVVALKILSSELTKDKAFIELFIKEARSAAQLNHNNIVQVYDVGRFKNFYYISMEYMGKGSLQELMSSERSKIPLAEALPIFIDAARGLVYAERKGIVHRDIKPDNLMVTDENVTKIGDLGLATTQQEDKREEGIYGTPHYIAPEQAMGRKVDTRADVYALGATFYRVLAGRTPFLGATVRAIIQKQLLEDPTPLLELEPSLDPEIWTIIQKMMQKSPEDRYQSATELVDDLVVLQRKFETGTKGLVLTEGRRARSKFAPFLIALVIFLGIAVPGIYLVFVSSNRQPLVAPQPNEGNGKEDNNGIVEPPPNGNGSDAQKTIENMARDIYDQRFPIELLQHSSDLMTGTLNVEERKSISALIESLREFAGNETYEGTGAAVDALRKAKRFEGKLELYDLTWNSAASERDEIISKADALQNAERFAESLAVLNSFADEYRRFRELAEQINDKKKRVGSAADKAVNAYRGLLVKSRTGFAATPDGREDITRRAQQRLDAIRATWGLPDKIKYAEEAFAEFKDAIAEIRLNEYRDAERKAYALIEKTAVPPEDLVELRFDRIAGRFENLVGDINPLLKRPRAKLDGIIAVYGHLKVFISKLVDILNTADGPCRELEGWEVSGIEFVAIENAVEPWGDAPGFRVKMRGGGTIRISWNKFELPEIRKLVEREIYPWLESDEKAYPVFALLYSNFLYNRATIEEEPSRLRKSAKKQLEKVMEIPGMELLIGDETQNLLAFLRAELLDEPLVTEENDEDVAERKWDEYRKAKGATELVLAREILDEIRDKYLDTSITRIYLKELKRSAGETDAQTIERIRTKISSDLLAASHRARFREFVRNLTSNAATNKLAKYMAFLVTKLAEPKIASCTRERAAAFFNAQNFDSASEEFEKWLEAEDGRKFPRAADVNAEWLLSDAMRYYTIFPEKTKAGEAEQLRKDAWFRLETQLKSPDALSTTGKLTLETAKRILVNTDDLLYEEASLIAECAARPLDINCRLRLCVFYAEKTPRALELYMELEKLRYAIELTKPTDWSSYETYLAMRAQTYGRFGIWGSQRAVFAELAEKFPKNPAIYAGEHAWFAAYGLLAAKADYGKAADAFDVLKTEFPQHPNVLDGTALWWEAFNYYLAGEKAAADRTLKAFAEKFPANPFNRRRGETPAPSVALRKILAAGEK